MKNFWSVILISLWCCTNSYGQDIQTSAAIADDLFLNKEYSSAEYIYKRIIFFDKTRQYDSLSFNRIAYCNFLLENYSEAAKYYDFSFNISGNQDDFFNAIICHIKSDNMNIAKLNLLNFSMEHQSSSIHHLKTQAFLVLVNLELKNPEEAAIHLDQVKEIYSSLHEVSFLEEDFIKRYHRVIKKFNPKKAAAFSLALPGSGQALSGDFSDGLNSLAINAVFTALYFSVAQSLGVIDAMIIVFPWLSKYYIGGYNNAKKSAKSRREKELKYLKNDLIDEFQSYGVMK